MMTITHENSSHTWKPNPSAPLWFEEEYIGKENAESKEDVATRAHFFQDLKLQHKRQVGPTCVPTTLAMLASSTGANVTTNEMKHIINTQSPHTWSNALKPYGFQLAYCNTDQRRLKYFIDELIEMDDLFLISIYSSKPPSDPDSDGKLCTAHLITIHRDTIYDTAKNQLLGVVKAVDYSRLERETKRIFRVVPVEYPRCI